MMFWNILDYCASSGFIYTVDGSIWESSKKEDNRSISQSMNPSVDSIIRYIVVADLIEVTAVSSL